MIFTPEPYQERIISHLLGHEHAALWCGMSLGKTACTLAALTELLETWEIRGALVVAPLRVANVVWPMEVRKWEQFRWLEVVSLRTPEGRKALKDGSAHIYLINYEMLPKLAGYLRKAKSVPFDCVVWDEISMAKNHNSKRINCVRKHLWKFCTHHWGLTGTPAPNSYLDVFAQTRLLDGGERFGPSYNHFRETYFHPTDWNKYNWEINDDGKERIHRKLSDMVLSMRTSDYLDLPDIEVEDHLIDLPEGARECYRELEKELLVTLESGEEILAVNAAVLVGKLLQITSGAVYTDEGYQILHDGKVAAVKKLLKGRGPTLVVYNFVHELERLRKALPRATVFAEAKGAEAQKAICERWNSGKIPALLVHPQAMSHGLNLQGGGADIIWTSLTYSRERYDQLNARLARRGQAQITRITRIMARDSIDFAVAEVLRSKGNRQEALMSALKTMGKLL